MALSVVVLPAPFGTEQTEDLAATDLEAHPVDGDLRPVGDRELVDLEERGAIVGRRGGHRPDGIERGGCCRR